jgi:hypothetical protein
MNLNSYASPKILTIQMVANINFTFILHLLQVDYHKSQKFKIQNFELPYDATSGKFHT